jgi:guanosine-3',5'-bis(diphosphate) 3'-pyrophosphohydrolase
LSRSHTTKRGRRVSAIATCRRSSRRSKGSVTSRACIASSDRQTSAVEFPFHIIFRERGGVIQILAVGHYRRRPRYSPPALGDSDPPMSTIERAIEIAARAHAGQVDKAGAPYVFHPLRLMLSLDTPEQQMAAVLHDVVEDTSITVADLEAEGFSTQVVEAVRVLTKLPGESRLDAAHRAVRNPIARAVKLADVADNMNLERIANPTEKDYARLEEYEQVKQLLERGA